MLKDSCTALKKDYSELLSIKGFLERDIKNCRKIVCKTTLPNYVIEHEKETLKVCIDELETVEKEILSYRKMGIY